MLGVVMRPYDLRRSFASLMLHEGRVGIVDPASQLGHSPTMTLNTYGHVIAELREAPKQSAADQITAARNRDPKTTPPTRNATSREPEDRVAPTEPTPGLEPGTPSLRGDSGETELVLFGSAGRDDRCWHARPPHL
jgi:hypothetical protein